MRRKDIFDEVADDIVFENAAVRAALESSDDGALSEAMAGYLRSLPLATVNEMLARLREYRAADG